MTPILLDSVKQLLNLGVGDVGRLEHIKDSLEKNKTLYSSDKNYVENKIKQYIHNSEYTANNDLKEKYESLGISLTQRETTNYLADKIQVYHSEELRQKEDEERTARNNQRNAEIKKMLEQTQELEKVETEENTSHDLYVPEQIETIDNSISIRIFYDAYRKNKKYWESTDTLDRIKFSSPEIQEELKIKQNKITLRISTNSGDAYRFAKWNTGGNMDIWIKDSSGYYFQVHLSIDEEFLKKIIIKHIRFCYHEMSIYESKLSITSFLPRVKVDYSTASEILKRITKSICDEINQDMGSIIIEEKLRR